MIHCFLAAFFVTGALVSLAFETWSHKTARVGQRFSAAYALGTIAWGLLALFEESTGLVVIAAIQFACCVFLFFHPAAIGE